MLENLRRKSLVKTYNDPIYATKFEHGHVICGNISRFGKHIQRLSKENQEKSFPSTFDVIFPSFVYTCMESKFSMIYCPRGTFIMGHKDQDDNPPRLETIERSFLLGETEITQELYKKVIGENPSKFQNSPQNPVERVSWRDAILFCNELSKLQGLDECYTKNSNEVYDWSCDFSKNGYRLPKEKEWEYAAKAGTNNQYAGTNNEAELGDYAWFGDNSTINHKDITHPVKTKKPNEWGLYDMSGNLSEWCWDKYDPDALDDPNTPANRVVRGGGFYSNALGLCSAYRHTKSPDTRGGGELGFRVCRSILN